MRLYALAIALLLPLLAWATPAPAQDAAKAQAPQAAPAASATGPQKTPDQAARKTPVAVEHDDADPLGARLAYHVKELLGRSALMVPSTKDEKKLVIVLKTKEEFPGRPNLCSMYAVSWLFAAKEGSLKYFLTSEVGTVDASGVDAAAEAILGQTAKLAGTYGYLF
ncbi:MAG: hypothetical protein AB7U59_13930 [Desulfovibrionaceae bacterium]|jgi:hypothetical protein